MIDGDTVVALRFSQVDRINLTYDDARYYFRLSKDQQAVVDSLMANERDLRIAIDAKDTELRNERLISDVHKVAKEEYKGQLFATSEALTKEERRKRRWRTLCLVLTGVAITEGGLLYFSN